MGVQTDFFVATRQEVNDTDWDSDEAQEFELVEMNGIDPVKLSTLETLLESDPDESDSSEFNEPVWQSPSGEGWVLPISKRLQYLLIQLSDSNVKAVAKSWTETEEMEADSFTQKDAEWVISNLVSLAKKGNAEGKEFFVWISL